MITKLSRQEKIKVMQDGFDACMKNHRCGNYLTTPSGEAVQWDILIGARSYKLIAYAEKRVTVDYDFDFSFDSNLEALVEELYLI